MRVVLMLWLILAVLSRLAGSFELITHKRPLSTDQVLFLFSWTRFSPQSSFAHAIGT